MTSLHLPTIRLQRLAAPRWGWYLFVLGVALIGSLPALVVRIQIEAALDEFDAVGAGRMSVARAFTKVPLSALDGMARNALRKKDRDLE